LAPILRARDHLPNVYLPNADTWVIESNGLTARLVAT